MNFCFLDYIISPWSRKIEPRSGRLNELIKVLELEPVEADLFRSQNPAICLPIVFGE